MECADLTQRLVKEPPKIVLGSTFSTQRVSQMSRKQGLVWEEIPRVDMEEDQEEDLVKVSQVVLDRLEEGEVDLVEGVIIQPASLEMRLRLNLRLNQAGSAVIIKQHQVAVIMELAVLQASQRSEPQNLQVAEDQGVLLAAIRVKPVIVDKIRTQEH